MSKISTAKKLLKWILLTYVAITIFVIVSQEYSSSSKIGSLTWSKTSQITVTYFFGTKRCSMCKNMELWANEVTQNLSLALSSSAKTPSSKVPYPTVPFPVPSLTFQTIPWQDEKNKAFVDHYKLLGNALIISYADKGKEVAQMDLINIWDVAHDEKKYKEYVKIEFHKFINTIAGKPLPLPNLDGGGK